jgi:FixJ family two-component response regulator
VIFLNGSVEVVEALRAIRAGTYDCLPDSLDNDQVVPWVQETVERHWFSGLRKQLIKDGLERTRKLTPREKDMLVMVVAGRNNREIAVHYKVSLHTVANHRANILKKTRSRNTADLVRIVTIAFMTELSECVEGS